MIDRETERNVSGNREHTRSHRSQAATRRVDMLRVAGAISRRHHIATSARSWLILRVTTCELPAAASTAMPISKTKQIPANRIFVSYSHADYRDAVHAHMVLQAMARRLGDTVIFLDSGGDQKLMAGDAWKSKILDALERADVFVVLMSIDYHASQFCRDVELKRMLERREARPDVRIIGIALHGVDLRNFSAKVGNKEVGLADYQCIPQAILPAPSKRLGLKPVNKWRDRRDAWEAVANQIEEALLQQRQAFGASKSPAPAAGLVPPAAADATTATRQLSSNFLPYLCDRDPQAMALIERLASWSAACFRRPLVLVTEGRSEDCLNKWIERIRDSEFSKVLGFDEAGLSFGYFKPFKWPALTQPAPHEARQRFVRALAGVLGEHVLDSAEQFFAAHIRRGRPTLLWVDCPDNCAPDHARSALAGLIEVLKTCPSLSQRCQLVLAINLVRSATGEPNARAALAGEFASLLQPACKAGHLEAEMLGSLAEIESNDIEIWSHDEAVSAMLGEHPDLDTLCRQLPAGRDTWPMRQFAVVAQTWFRNP